MENIQSPINSISPTQKKEVLVSRPIIQMSFYEALKNIIIGNKVTKLEWNDKEYYGILDETHLKLHKPDGKLYDWILTDGDILGLDYIII